MDVYGNTGIISDKEHIKRAYIELLKVQDFKLRFKLNNELCILRGYIDRFIKRCQYTRDSGVL